MVGLWGLEPPPRLEVSEFVGDFPSPNMENNVNHAIQPTPKWGSGYATGST